MRKRKSVSAWCLDKCWDRDKVRGTANVQNTTVAPTSKDGLWYILWMSERQLYYTDCTDCWLETAEQTLCIPFYYTVRKVILCLVLSVLVCPVVSSGRAERQRQWFSSPLFAPPCCVAFVTNVHPVACVMTATNPAGFRCQSKRGLLLWKPEITVRNIRSPENDSSPYIGFPEISIFSFLRLTKHLSL